MDEQLPVATQLITGAGDAATAMEQRMNAHCIIFVLDL